LIDFFLLRRKQALPFKADKKNKTQKTVNFSRMALGFLSNQPQISQIYTVFDADCAEDAEGLVGRRSAARPFLEASFCERPLPCPPKSY
jgi:hypothetical protein